MVHVEMFGYRDFVLVTLDEDGLEGLRGILEALRVSGVKFVEVETSGPGPTLRMAFESRTIREERERKQTEEAARRKAAESQEVAS
jgi:hypothetical protein